jgi:hypothetical protein
MESSVKFADPARTTIFDSSVENCTGAFGSFAAISARKS